MPAAQSVTSMPEAPANFNMSRAGALAVFCSALLLALANHARAGESGPAFGRPASATELAALPVHVFAEGCGLPPGSGDAVQGKVLYESQCADCHGSAGQGGSAMELVGDRSLLATEFPDRGIAVYWPYAPPLFEYIKRAMPPDKPYSLGDEEVYSVVAYLLELNELIAPGQRVDAALLSKLQMPNRNNFHSGYSDRQ